MRKIVPATAALLLLWLLWPLNTLAQEQSASYWNFPTSGRLQQLVTADVNGDGVAELLVAAENGRVDLVNASGQSLWNFEAGAPVLAISVLRAANDTAIALGLPNELLLLSADGDLLWRTPLEAAVPPPVLLTDGGRAALKLWQTPFTAVPTAIAPFDYDNDGQDEILLLLRSGQLQLYSLNGTRLWRYARNNNPTIDATPHLLVADFDGDGRQEALLGYFTPSRRFSRLVWVQQNGTVRWERPVDGRITALQPFRQNANDPPVIAVGTSLGNVNLYGENGQRLWPRTVNRSVTALAVAPLPDGPGLVVGTNSGSVYVFDRFGRRRLTAHLDPEASRRIVSLSAGAAQIGEDWPLLAAVIGPQPQQPGPTDMVLLAEDGRMLQTLTSIDEAGLSRLTDLNGDQLSELLLVQFPDLALLGLGVGASEIALEWSRVLRAVPLSYLVTDFNGDGVDELLVGDDNGRLHRFDHEGAIYLRIAPGGEIHHLAMLPAATEAPRMVLVRTPRSSAASPSHTLEVRLENGELLWNADLPAPVTKLLIGDVNGRGEAEIVVGTTSGTVSVFSASGTRLQQHTLLLGPIRHLLLLPESDPPAAEPQPRLLVGGERELYRLQTNGRLESIASFPQPITHLHLLPIADPAAGAMAELEPRLLVLTADGQAYALNWRGILLPPWPVQLGGRPLISQPNYVTPSAQADAPPAFLIATDQQTLVHLRLENGRPQLVWRLSGIGAIIGVQWGDVDGDSLPEIIVANRERNVLLFSQTPELISELALSSSAFGLGVLCRDVEQKSDLVVITDNGLAQLFRAQENRPPLLTSPSVDVRPGQYNLTVAVRDVEQDAVTLRLEMQDPLTGRWLPQSERLLPNGNGQAPFLIPEPLAAADGVRYRYFFADGFHSGYLTPPPGPRPMVIEPLLSPGLMLLGGVLAAGLVTAVVLVRQSKEAPSRARRFHRRLRQQPTRSLLLLENAYAYNHASPEFLLYLTSQARQSGDWLVASLTDGLFLLADRPHAALSILNSALDECAQQQPAWECLPRWRMMYRVGQALLEAPSITELALLYPQLTELLHLLEEAEQWSPALDGVLPILATLHDSERVELAEDRLVYLNEAAAQIAALEEHLPEFGESMEKTLTRALLRRWQGLVVAEIEQLRGRADLVIALKTKRLIPNGRSQLALEIQNNGRAAAEEVLAVLEERPSYLVHTPPQIIPLIPPGRKRQISFEIEPQVLDHFRIALTLTYNDRNQREKTLAFGDMVHLLSPARDFKPIANPYIPGSPLRGDSPLFYGRQELFNFIAENIGEQSQRNVLILVGQRRTGKTSALLQLEHHLPRHLIPVYVDCQSLGVTDGMPALLHEIAWLIADTLLNRDIQVAVPELGTWHADPRGLFQRQFLPTVQSLLPPHSTLILVFDEFEAIENLVQDGILPATIFTYLRHLMQHSQGLGFIFVGTRRLEEMSADYWSVLFNIALYQKIGYLSPESALRLITEPVTPALLYDDLALDKILRVTAGHPYFLQLVCYTLVKRANAQKTGYVTISDVNAALDEMLRLGEVHFAYLWQRSDYTERALLTAVSHLIDPDRPFHPEELIQALQPYDIHLSPGAVTAALQNLVERDIMREVTEQAKTLYELRIGLVGLWVAKNKSLTKLLYVGRGKEEG